MGVKSEAARFANFAGGGTAELLLWPTNEDGAGREADTDPADDADAVLLDAVLLDAVLLDAAGGCLLLLLEDFRAPLADRFDGCDAAGPAG